MSCFEGFVPRRPLSLSSGCSRRRGVSGAELPPVAFPRKPKAGAPSWGSPLPPSRHLWSGPGGPGWPVHRSLPSDHPRGVPKAWEEGALVQDDLAWWASRVPDGATLNRGRGLKSPGPLWPWPSGARACWVVAISSSPFCSAPTSRSSRAVRTRPAVPATRGAQLVGGLSTQTAPCPGVSPVPSGQPSGWRVAVSQPRG